MRKAFRRATLNGRSEQRIERTLIQISRETNSLLVPQNFIRAIRDSGYASLASALSELIDNSIQANAGTIDIRIDLAGFADLPSVVVSDDGDGMNEEELASCLRFGGSARFNSRTSFGRFGMGLPAASLSQARRVEVTSWRENLPAQFVLLEVDRVARGENVMLIPRAGIPGDSDSGCRVEWSECDRIEYRRIGWLEKSLRRDLGRIFRRFLAGGLVLRLNGAEVQPVDPTLLTTRVNGKTAELAFAPLTYEIATASGESSFVTVTFYALPVAQWHHLDNATKRRVGIVGQGGISILRAGREIADGWQLMGGKRKENYDDWWRCEIEFDPALDEHFGITVNKQGVRPSTVLREALEPELEAIARLLNGRVRQAFEEVKFEATVQGSCRIAHAADVELPVVLTSGSDTGALTYHLGMDQLIGEQLFNVKLKQRDVTVTVNVDHPGFSALYRPILDLGEEGATIRTAFELLLLSFARSVVEIDSDELASHKLLGSWGLTYGRMLQKA